MRMTEPPPNSEETIPKWVLEVSNNNNNNKQYKNWPRALKEYLASSLKLFEIWDTAVEGKIYRLLRNNEKQQTYFTL